MALRAVAEYADRWNVGPLSAAELEAKLEVLQRHCERFDRDPGDIRVTHMNDVVLRTDHEAAHTAYEERTALTASGPTPRSEDRGLIGTPAELLEKVAQYEEAGTETLIAKVPVNDRRTIELLVDEVIPEAV